MAEVDVEEGEPTRCPLCETPLLKVESCSEVNITYRYVVGNESWEEMDVDYCGETMVSYACSNCNWVGGGEAE